MSVTLKLQNISKFFGDFKAVDNVNLIIKQGEFFTLLGPSGCGKTTLLRMIAGFNPIDQGKIYFNDKCVNNLGAHVRNTGMVFQNYAIFPHLSVFDNVAYGLRARKVNNDEIKKRVAEALKLVKMYEYAQRQPNQLSGGQQQRVALARAIVIQPDVLLMDEPLCNLDAKLRVEMRSAIKKIQQTLNITTIYVTHDQEEALAISDRIAVMKKGHIQQVDTPEQIYDHPANQFVANFIGTSNFTEGEVVEIDANKNAKIKIFNKIITKNLQKEYKGKVIVSYRPTDITIKDKGEGLFDAEIVLATFLGDFITYEVLVEGQQMIIGKEHTKDMIKRRKNKEKVSFDLVCENIHVFNPSGEEVIS